MYDRMRTTFAGKLYDSNFGNEEVEKILLALDSVMEKYYITESSTALTVRAADQAMEMVKAYLIAKKVECKSDQTIKRYWYALRDFANHLTVPIQELKANDLRLYLHTYKTRRNVSDRTLESIRVVLLSFFSWLTEEEYIEKNPMTKIAPIKFEAKPRKAIDLYTLEQIRRACKDSRELCIVEVLYSTACRITELCDIKISDINFNTKEVHLFGKGKKHRTSYINARAEIAIKTYLSERKHQSEYLLCNERGGGQMTKGNVEKIFRALAKRVGLEGQLTPHVIRHTTATVAVNNGMSINEVQKMLGHEDISTTMIYAETCDDSVKRNHQKYIV